MVRKQSVLHQKANNKGYIYLLAGAFKGKKLEVLTSPGLRPIGSRVKEIFFNWIQFDIEGSSCLDLFAGSGALGFEALSRGAHFLQMYEYSPNVYKKLIQNYQGLNINQFEKIYGESPRVKIDQVDSYAKVKVQAQQDYNLVFVDPPFMQERELEVLSDLANNKYLRNQCLVFLQLDGAYENAINNLDARFSVEKFKKVGNILLYLLRFTAHQDNFTSTSSSNAHLYTVLG